MKKRFVPLFLSLSMLSVAISGCGNTQKSTTSTSASSTQTQAVSSTESSATSVTKVRVVTSSTYEPYCYVDENNNITGMEIDILKAIDKRAPEITCTYEYCSWDAMLPGLDSDRYDLAVYQLSKNADRESMYHFGELPYSVSDGDTIITTAAHKDWKTLDDVKATGKMTFGAITGSSFTEELEAYLKDHPDAFTLKYYDTEIDTLIEDLVNGRIDGFLNDPNVVMEKAKKAGYADKITLAGEISKGSASWYVFGNNDTGKKLSPIFDKYIKELYDDGTLSTIAKKWFGNDNCIQRLGSEGYIK